jgi:hypothetical protein
MSFGWLVDWLMCLNSCASDPPISSSAIEETAINVLLDPPWLALAGTPRPETVLQGGRCRSAMRGVVQGYQLQQGPIRGAPTMIRESRVPATQTFEIRAFVKFVKTTDVHRRRRPLREQCGGARSCMLLFSSHKSPDFRVTNS